VAVDHLAGATAENLIPWEGGHIVGPDPPGGGGHLRIRSHWGGHTPEDLPHIHVHLSDPAEGATSEDRTPAPGGATPSDRISRGGHIVRSDPPGGGGVTPGDRFRN
jgi:hypothetical protein